MSVHQTVWVSVLTAIYLCFELAFNARLLDVVGSAASNDQIHQIELFGRSLSGIAVALVLLQFLLSSRTRRKSDSPTGLAIVFWCMLSGLIVFGSLQILVEQLVERSTPEFRRASLNILLVQRALVNGGVQLDGLDDDTQLFTQPAGKAFLALFPVMAISIDRLDEKIRGAKLELIARHVRQELGGAAGYYARYVSAIQSTQDQWQRYQKIPTTVDLSAEVTRRQDRAWADYIADLGRRGWTPSTVPPMARSSVLRKVRSQVSLPSNWDLSDEASFREAVARQVRKRAGATRNDGNLIVKGHRIPPGLSWSAFFAHTGIQAELREKLKLPAGMTLQPSYANGASFDRDVFTPLVRETAKRELRSYDAPLNTFTDGSQNTLVGLDAARAVIVPPIALFFSLLGAVGHLAKLSYLLLRLLVVTVPFLNTKARHLWIVPFCVLALVWTGLSWSENAVTRSRLYAYMNQQVLQSKGPAAGLLINALHVVAVGQAYGYPINESVRTRLLGGITYGYKEQNASR